MKIIGGISMLLLLVILLLQVTWVNRARRMKVDEFQKSVSFVWSESINNFFDGEFLRPGVGFSCGMKDEHVFTWKDKSDTLSSSQEFHFMMRRVLYDHLYENQLLDLQRLDSVYRVLLLEKGKISAFPALYVKNEAGEVIVSRGERRPLGNIVTPPVEVGHECQHMVYAVFAKPPFFRDMFWIMMVEVIFLVSVIACMLWQLQITRDKLQTAKVQAMGIAHLEHELRKPLALLISQTKDEIFRERPSISARLLKISDVTEMMLFALKRDSLEIERMPVDIRQELDMTVGMFRLLKEYAKVDYQVDESIGEPLLDKVYFGCVLSNLIDNGIKYNCNPNPEVHVYFGKEAENWILRVEDNGIGIPEKKLKRIFGQFYRVEDKRMFAKTGFGLGLTFVKKVVDAYGGSIVVKSCPEQGTVFTIKIPCLS